RPREPRQAPPAAQPHPQPKPKGKWTQVEVDPYTDADGNLRYEVCRIQWKLPVGSLKLSRKGKPDKSFRQRRPSGRGDGSKVWGLGAGEYMREAPGRDWKPFDAAVFAEWNGGERGLFLEAVEHTIFAHPEVEIAISEVRTII